ncbi:MAG TPA: SOS response-associated peptidase [Acidimicrobiales bacterium]|jgi:putative SOS response-associated peptidase YedK|nr:SOS response-associated peptidase [Acidimicrobiales bacterium]
MCGRFVSATPAAQLAEAFRVEEVKVPGDAAPLAEANYNVAPTNDVVAVAVSKDGQRQLGTFHWGLVPSWAKDRSIGNRMINLRADTVKDKPSFRRILGKRRCIIPADGFYEWKDMGKGRKKQPFFIRARDGSPLALAGLWEVWKDRALEAEDPGSAEWLKSCTIITTEPNGLLAPIHNRMPVVLPPEVWDTWLDPANDDVDALEKLLVPAPDDLLELYPVSLEVNSVQNNGPQLVEPLEGHEAEGTGG